MTIDKIFKKAIDARIEFIFFNDRRCQDLIAASQRGAEHVRKKLIA